MKIWLCHFRKSLQPLQLSQWKMWSSIHLFIPLLIFVIACSWKLFHCSLSFITFKLK
jgi:hypothetical protein